MSQYYSPRAIVTGKPLDYNNNCKHSFGSYVIALNENNPTNTPAPRGLDCIFLDSNDNPAGGFELLHLATNKVITRCKITEIPLTQAVINRVEKLAQRDGVKDKLHFLTRKKGKFSNKPDDDDDALLAGVDEQPQNPEPTEEEDDDDKNQNENKNQNIVTDDEEEENDDESMDSQDIQELKDVMLDPTTDFHPENMIDDDEQANQSINNDDEREEDEYR